MKHKVPPRPQTIPVFKSTVTVIKIYLSIITLSINGPNSLIKSLRMSEWIKKENPFICCLQEIQLSFKDRYCLRVKEWTKVLQSNGTRKQEAIAILISNKCTSNESLPEEIKRDTSL